MCVYASFVLYFTQGHLQLLFFFYSFQIAQFRWFYWYTSISCRRPSRSVKYNSDRFSGFPSKPSLLLLCYFAYRFIDKYCDGLKVYTGHYVHYEMLRDFSLVCGLCVLLTSILHTLMSLWLGCWYKVSWFKTSQGAISHSTVGLTFTCKHKANIERTSARFGIFS